MTNRRYNRLLSDAKPEGIKPSTWALLQGANARRRALLAGKGNAAKAKSLARYLWGQKDAVASYRPTIVARPSRPAPIGPSIPQTMWLASIGRAV